MNKNYLILMFVAFAALSFFALSFVYRLQGTYNYVSNQLQFSPTIVEKQDGCSDNNCGEQNSEGEILLSPKKEMSLKLKSFIISSIIFVFLLAILAVLLSVKEGNKGNNLPQIAVKKK